MSFSGRVVLVVGLLLVVGGCTTSPPDKLDNICDIFREKDGWYADAKDARERWGAPISIMMAFMHQESRFVAGAKPPRTKIWGIIPGPRASDAYGYSQAKNDTWDWYKRKSGNHGADRDKFEDAIDFVGWYNHTTYQINGIAKDDAFQTLPQLSRGARRLQTRNVSLKTMVSGGRKESRSARIYV